MKKVKVAVVMGSDSDMRVMKDAVETLHAFKVAYSTKVVSAHRTPQEMLDFAKSARDQGVEVIIAGAGGAAHLPGMIASATTLPVIGVPVQLKHLDGLDSLLSVAQMPKGVPVATMAIDNATNAALFALRILSLSDKKIALKLAEHQKEMKMKVKKANKNLKQVLTSK
jgi:5-(carboxyamino)imidazole ribonucleotide mutase